VLELKLLKVLPEFNPYFFNVVVDPDVLQVNLARFSLKTTPLHPVQLNRYKYQIVIKSLIGL
jgi:hypothetical protein